MKVFHGIIEIAGQMGILCAGLKKCGHIAVGYNTFHSYLGYKDNLLNTDSVQIQKSFKHIANFFDIFHYHYGVPIWPGGRDLERLQRRGKKMLMHHWGNDVRFHNQAKLMNKYVYTGDSPPNKEIHEKLLYLSNYFHEAIVQDNEVLSYVKPYYSKVHVLPLAINLDLFSPIYPSASNSHPLIIHAPTNPDFKGTVIIEKAIHELKSSFKFKYTRVERLSSTQARTLYRKADIIIDQIRCGTYGLFSVEAMALGKPVIAYIRPDLANSFPTDLPILSANPDNIKDALKNLLENPALRHELGTKGPLYVKKYHSSDIIVKKLLKIYDNAK